MELAESQAEAARILEAAGWQADAGWGGFNYGTCVGGIAPNGSVYVKNWAAIAPGHPKYGPDTPDEPHEAAAWLVAQVAPKRAFRFKRKLASLPEEQQSQGHESDGETGAEAQAADHGLAGGSADPGGDHQGSEDDQAGDGIQFGDELSDAEIIDADFGSVEAVGELSLGDVFTEDPLLEFGGEVLEEHPEDVPPPQDRFYGLDDLDRRRSLRIGDVVRISRLKQAEIALLMGDDDFAAIQNAVLRDTVDGFYKGPPDIYATFVELSRHKSAINRVKAAEADKVAFLEAATRPDLEAFNPDADWP